MTAAANPGQQYQLTLGLYLQALHFKCGKIHTLKKKTVYPRLHLPVNAHPQNLLSRHVKRLRFRCQTLKFSFPNVKFYFLTLLKGKMFSINKKGRNYQKGVPLSSDLRRIIPARRSKALKKLNHFRTVPKFTFQDHI